MFTSNLSVFFFFTKICLQYLWFKSFLGALMITEVRQLCYRGTYAIRWGSLFEFLVIKITRILLSLEGLAWHADSLLISVSWQFLRKRKNLKIYRHQFQRSETVTLILKLCRLIYAKKIGNLVDIFCERILQYDTTLQNFYRKLLNWTNSEIKSIYCNFTSNCGVQS